MIVNAGRVKDLDPGCGADIARGIFGRFAAFPDSAIGRVTKANTSCDESRSALKVGTANGPVPNMISRMKNSRWSNADTANNDVMVLNRMVLDDHLGSFHNRLDSSESIRDPKKAINNTGLRFQPGVP